MAAPELEDRRAAMRRFVQMGTAAWTMFFVTDVVAARAHEAPLEYLAALRFMGTGIGIAAYVVVRHTTSARVLDAVEALVTPIASLLIALSTIPCGGIASPLAQGIAIVTMSRAVLPAPLARSLPAALASAAMFPLTLGTAAALAPGIALQFRSPAVWSFVLTTLFLVLAAGVTAATSHLQWDARERVREATRLGAYRLVARIAAGGMGEVWLARQLPLDRPVALKLLKERTLRDPRAIARFRREAHAASRLAHPHTIRIFDFGASDDGVFFLAMELLEGMDLQALIDQAGPLPPARAVHLARQACASLAEAHHHGVVHCDVKPANVFVTRVGDECDFVKVLDFGLARVAHVATGTTAGGQEIRGTPAFMPPEIVRGERVGPESDVYAMGALLYFMVTGTTIFHHLSFHETMIAALEGTPEAPSTRLGRPVPEDLEAVIQKCLAKGRGDRFVTARELEIALAACACAADWTQVEAKQSWLDLRPSLHSIVTKPG